MNALLPLLLSGCALHNLTATGMEGALEGASSPESLAHVREIAGVIDWNQSLREALSITMDELAKPETDEIIRQKATVLAEAVAGVVEARLGGLGADLRAELVRSFSELLHTAASGQGKRDLSAIAAAIVGSTMDVVGPRLNDSLKATWEGEVLPELRLALASAVDDEPKAPSFVRKVSTQMVAGIGDGLNAGTGDVVHEFLAKERAYFIADLNGSSRNFERILSAVAGLMASALAIVLFILYRVWHDARQASHALRFVASSLQANANEPEVKKVIEGLRSDRERQPGAKALDSFLNRHSELKARKPAVREA